MNVYSHGCSPIGSILAALVLAFLVLVFSYRFFCFFVVFFIIFFVDKNKAVWLLGTVAQLVRASL